MAPKIPPVCLTDLLNDHFLRDVDAELGLDFEQDLHEVEFFNGRINLSEGDGFLMIQADVWQLALRRNFHPFKRLWVESRSVVPGADGLNLRSVIGWSGMLQVRQSPPE